jgi:predicted dehydrogenase
MLAENYPQMKFNREIKRICDGGTLGKILYAEGEYNHPANLYDTEFLKHYVYFNEHWRNYLPRSYYITHSLAPIMWATGATPKKVSAMATFAPFEEKVNARMVGDRAAIVTTFNDDGSVFKVSGCAAFGAHHNAYRVCGINGQIENLRGMDGKIMLRYNAWSKPEGMDEINLYDPEWNDKDEELIKTSGHGGGDYITARLFLEAIEEKKMPEIPYDIYSAVALSSVAILAHRSVLEGGKPFDIPDFRNEDDCRLYENDRLSPFYGTDGGEPTLPACSVPEFKPTEKQLELYNEMVSKF